MHMTSAVVHLGGHGQGGTDAENLHGDRIVVGERIEQDVV
jgi:hypothetical protein